VLLPVQPRLEGRDLKDVLSHSKRHPPHPVGQGGNLPGVIQQGGGLTWTTPAAPLLAPVLSPVVLFPTRAEEGKDASRGGQGQVRRLAWSQPCH